MKFPAVRYGQPDPFQKKSDGVQWLTAKGHETTG
jgi:hypothetical protein